MTGPPNVSLMAIAGVALLETVFQFPAQAVVLITVVHTNGIFEAFRATPEFWTALIGNLQMTVAILKMTELFSGTLDSLLAAANDFAQVMTRTKKQIPNRRSSR